MEIATSSRFYIASRDVQDAPAAACRASLAEQTSERMLKKKRDQLASSTNFIESNKN